jgi:hypothetical protein
MSDRLAEIRARLDVATPGPWRVIEPLQQTARPPRRMLVADLEAPQQSSELGNVQLSWFDTRFIAHAPADIAWLLDRLDYEREFHKRESAELRDALESAVADLEQERERHA